MRYPTPEEYMKAVQRSESFTTAELRGLQLVTHPLYGIPMPAAGTSAVVFKAVVNGEAQALRFFTRDDAWSGERYGALHEHFTARGLASAVAMPRWIDDGIRVNGSTWPVVQMQWVEGHTLNRHVEELIMREDTGSLSALAQSWRDLVTRLQRAEFAHGDLQHGNVLVDTSGDMRLVDFDCAWIESLSGVLAPSETGHRNYQPLNRPWGRWMDTFSGLVIYLSLLALARNPASWRTLNTGENLLFRQEDFQSPFETPAWAHLSGMRDDRLDEIAARLKECCKPGWTATAGLDDLLVPRAKPWWELTPRGLTEAAAAPRTPAPQPVSRPLRQPQPLPQPVPRSQPDRRSPTGQWWVEPAAARVPAEKRPKVSTVLAIALALGIVALVIGAAAEIPPGAFVFLGLIVAAVTTTIGLANRKPRA